MAKKKRIGFTNLVVYSFLFLALIYNVFLASLSVRLGEINLTNDVGRDFLLLQELDQKKIVLIGPRSSTNGLFHGPLLTYIDYPAYLLGKGNPITVGWFWIGSAILFLITSFFMARKLFGAFAAAIFAVLLSQRIVPHINSVFEPEAMFFFMPAFLFTIIQYINTKKLKYLVLHLILISILIQLSIGIGLQLFILSSIMILVAIYRRKVWKHLFAFFIIPLLTANFIVFDIRHSFTMTKALFSTGGSGKFFITISDWIINRVNNTVFMQLFEANPAIQIISLVSFLCIVICSVLILRDKKNKLRSTYFIFMYFYFGYMISTYVNKGVLLFHYIYLLVPFSLLWFTSFLGGKYRILFLVLACILFAINFNYNKSYVDHLRVAFMGKHPNSWSGLRNVADYVIKQQGDNEFGYFVFSPDSFAYQPRYAMIYNFQAAQAKANEYAKKKTTYIIAQGAPPNDPYMDYKWWVKVPLGITTKPNVIKKFPNGYTVLKYELTPEEQKIPFDRNIELGIHFR